MTASTLTSGQAPRSGLFVPATRTERIAKALASGTDMVIVDLEDAVEQGAKESARAGLDAFLRQHPDVRVLVRINGAATPEHEADLAMCNAHAAVAGIVLPMAEQASQIAHVAAGGKPVWPIVESAPAMLALAELAVAPGVVRLAFGSLDYGLEFGLHQNTAGGETMLDHARCQILLHSRIAGIGAPLDGVYPAISDSEGLLQRARRARDMGFAGMLCIHPAQVPTIHEAFAVAEADLAWARGIFAEIERTGQTTFRLNGEMVDAPVIARARDLLARAGESA